MKLEKCSSSTLQDIQGFVSSFCSFNDMGNLFSPSKHTAQRQEIGSKERKKKKGLVLGYFLHKTHVLI